MSFHINGSHEIIKSTATVILYASNRKSNNDIILQTTDQTATFTAFCLDGVP